MLINILFQYHNVTRKWRCHYYAIILYSYILHVLHNWIGYPRLQWLQIENRKSRLLRCRIEIRIKGIKSIFSIYDSEVSKVALVCEITCMLEMLKTSWNSFWKNKILKKILILKISFVKNFPNIFFYYHTNFTPYTIRPVGTTV